MPDKITDHGVGIAEPALPSFVRQISNGDGDLVTCFDFWAPSTTGFAPLDYDLGRQHCRAALACARQLGSANLLLYVVMAMHGRPVGGIERGFIAELISPALAGRIPAFVSDEVMREVASVGGDVEALRASEAFMARAINGSGANPELFYNYVVELVSGPQSQWIAAAIYLLVGAALNGSLH